MKDDSGEDYRESLTLTSEDKQEKDNYSNKRSSDSDLNGMFSATDNVVYQTEENLLNSDEKISFFGISNDSQISVIINIVSSAIGGSCFNFPSILDILGLPCTLVVFTLIMISIYYTIDLLRSFVVDTRYFSFALISEKILGSIWMKIYVISSLIFYLSIEINYISEIYSIVSKMVGISGNDYIKIIIYFILTLLFEIFICSYTSNIKKIHIFSFLSIIFFLIILITVIILGILNLSSEENKLEYSSFITPNIDNNLELFFIINSFSIEYIYGYSYHSSFPTLLGNFQNHIEEENTKNVHIISFIIISISYLLMTFFGYLLKSKVPEILFIDDESFQENTPLKIIFKLILCLFLFIVISLRFIVIRDNYTSLFGKQKIAYTKDLIATSICLIFCNIITYFTSENKLGYNIISYFIQLFGGIFGIIICYFLPVINYIGVNGKRKIKSIIGYILTIFFLIVGIISVFHSVHGIFFSDKY